MRGISSCLLFGVVECACYVCMYVLLMYFKKSGIVLN